MIPWKQLEVVLQYFLQLLYVFRSVQQARATSIYDMV